MSVLPYEPNQFTEEGRQYMRLQERCNELSLEVDRLRREHVEDVDRMERAAICIENLTKQLNERHAHEPEALRDALASIASPSRTEDYGWWTQVARRALGIATANETRDVCKGCGNEIDPTTCHCGEPIEGHGHAPGHGPVPMGCDCMRSAPPPGLVPLSRVREVLIETMGQTHPHTVESIMEELQ